MKQAKQPTPGSQVYSMNVQKLIVKDVPAFFHDGKELCPARKNSWTEEGSDRQFYVAAVDEATARRIAAAAVLFKGKYSHVAVSLGSFQEFYGRDQYLKRFPNRIWTDKKLLETFERTSDLIVETTIRLRGDEDEYFVRDLPNKHIFSIKPSLIDPDEVLAVCGQEAPL